jgi:DNA damage-inducible protein 1
MQLSCSYCTSVMVVDVSKMVDNQVLCPVCFSEIKISDEFLTNILEANKHQELIDDNLEKAYNEIPHTFIPSKMIHLTAKINGVDVKFLVDTGAQMSILPLSIVTACDMKNLIDEKYNGELKGVGSDKIMGRIHYLELQLPCGVYPCGFTVCKNDEMIPLLGIDMMRNLGLTLDFSKNKMSFEGGKYELSFE